MHEINLRSKKKRNIYPRITILLLFIVFLILAKATWGVFLKNKETRNNLNEVESDLNELRNREADLTDEIKRLNTERGIDEEIRTKFRVVKDGEGMIILVDSPQASTTLDVDSKKGFWSKVFDLFR